MKNKYKKKPIPKMLSNVKIRAKQKSINFNLTTKYLKKTFSKGNICPITGVNFQFGYKNHDKKTVILYLRLTE